MQIMIFYLFSSRGISKRIVFFMVVHVCLSLFCVHLNTLLTRFSIVFDTAKYVFCWRIFCFWLAIESFLIVADLKYIFIRLKRGPVLLADAGLYSRRIMAKFCSNDWLFFLIDCGLNEVQGYSIGWSLKVKIQSFSSCVSHFNFTWFIISINCFCQWLCWNWSSLAWIILHPIKRSFAHQNLFFAL